VVDVAFALAALRGGVRGGGLGRPAAALEAGRLAAGTALAMAAYFGQARPPEPRVAHAARRTAPLRGAGLLAASLGRRRPADALVGAGALAGAGAVLRQAARPRS
jgi:hypothetical protein